MSGDDSSVVQLVVEFLLEWGEPVELGLIGTHLIDCTGSRVDQLKTFLLNHGFIISLHRASKYCVQLSDVEIEAYNEVKRNGGVCPEELVKNHIIRTFSEQKWLDLKKRNLGPLLRNVPGTVNLTCLKMRSEVQSSLNAPVRENETASGTTMEQGREMAEVQSSNKGSEQQVVIINNNVDCRQAVWKLSKSTTISLDTEGDLRENGEICLVQMTGGVEIDRNVIVVYLFDFVRAWSKEEMARQLEQLLSSDKITKIVHDGRKDAEALFGLYGIVMMNVLDTQVIYTSLMEMRGNQVRRMGLNDLLHNFKLPKNSVKETVKKQYLSEGPLFWTRRPMSEEMILYAAEDVLPLSDLLQRLLHEGEKSFLSFAHRRSEMAMSNSMRSDNPVQCSVSRVGRLSFTENYEMVVEETNETPEEEETADFSTTNDLEDLITSYPVIPDYLKEAVISCGAEEQLPITEIVVDAERVPIVRFADDTEKYVQSYSPSVFSDAVNLCEKKEEKFSKNNRMGIQGTLHRISCIRAECGDIVGLTYRVGRHVDGVCDMIVDILSRLVPTSDAIKKGTASPCSLLLLGRPGVGKTTLLRDVAKFLSDKMSKRVVVVDTSGEIGGYGTAPHEAIGRARRMPVPDKKNAHGVLTEAVQNHSPQVVIIDEIGTREEVNAARSISQRGVSMVATAHGVSLSSLLKDPVMNQLVGGVRSVILSAQEVKDRKSYEEMARSGKKSRVERGGEPTFSIVIEILMENTSSC